MLPVLRRFIRSSILSDLAYQHTSSIKTLLSHSQAKDIIIQCGVCITELAKLQLLLEKRVNKISKMNDKKLVDFIDINDI